MAEKTTKKIEKLAVIETGGKQYLVKPGDKIKVEKLKKPEKGSVFSFEKVLLLVTGENVKIGTPYIAGVKIKGKWLVEKRARKVTNVRYKSKTRQATKRGHRQSYSEILIVDF